MEEKSMRVTVAMAVLLCALPILSQEQGASNDVLRQALHALPQHIQGLQHHALPNGDDIRQYIIANATVSGAEKGLFESAGNFYGAALAEEILASYQELNSQVARIDLTDLKGAPVLALDEFATGPATYDWTRLREKHPKANAVLRVSQPATAANYALVRVEIISPAGKLWGNFIELERQEDGSWKYTRAVAGDLWD
jgi:hypothetical protein